MCHRHLSGELLNLWVQAFAQHVAFLFCSLVSLENVLLDVKELQRGLDLTKREYTMHDHNTMLKDFIQNNEGKLKKLQDDAKIAQVLLYSRGLARGCE